MLSKVNVDWFWSEKTYTICIRWSYHLNWDNKIWNTWDKINCVCHAIGCWLCVQVQVCCQCCRLTCCFDQWVQGKSAVTLHRQWSFGLMESWNIQGLIGHIFLGDEWFLGIWMAHEWEIVTLGGGLWWVTGFGS